MVEAGAGGAAAAVPIPVAPGADATGPEVATGASPVLGSPIDLTRVVRALGQRIVDMELRSGQLDETVGQTVMQAQAEFETHRATMLQLAVAADADVKRLQAGTSHQQ